MGRLEVTVIALTNHPIDAYGGVQMPDEALHQLAERFRANGLRTQVNHDSSRRLDSRCIHAEVVTLDDGYKGVKAILNVDADAWAAYERECEDQGAPGGMSVSATQTISAPETAPTIIVAANAAWFPDDVIEAAAAYVADEVPVATERLYEFSFEPPVHVLIQLAGVYLLGPAVYDLAKSFLRHRVAQGEDSPTTIDVMIRSGEGAEIYKLETSDPEAVERALSLIPSASDEPGAVLVWDESREAWMSPRA